jgi:transcription antitermination factor NusG
VAATMIVVMSQSDIAKKQAAERADWDRRGVTGLVTASTADSLTISVRTLAGAKPMVIAPAANAIVRRYAPDSVSFADAKPSTLAEIKTGDQVRARGDKNEDGSRMSALEIVSGNFRTMAGVILSIDAAAKEMQVRDLETKKPVTVKIVADSSVKKIQPQLAQTLAQRLHGEAAGAGAARGQGNDGRAQGGDGGGRGSGGGRGFGGGRGNADLQTMLDSSPNIMLADLKNGDAIVVSSTVGATAGKVTAIKLLAGVEPILTKPGTQEMALGSWDIGGAFGGGGGQ